ncbi:hypothetical protein D3C87_1325480 [compost metagenome]
MVMITGYPLCFPKRHRLSHMLGNLASLESRRILPEDVSLSPSRYKSQVIYLSQDAKVFKEFMLDEGGWQHICANKQGILSVYSPDSHETFLKVGQFVCQPKG